MSVSSFMQCIYWYALCREFSCGGVCLMCVCMWCVCRVRNALHPFTRLICAIRQFVDVVNCTPHSNDSMLFRRILVHPFLIDRLPIFGLNIQGEILDIYFWLFCVERRHLPHFWSHDPSPIALIPMKCRPSMHPNPAKKISFSIWILCYRLASAKVMQCAMWNYLIGWNVKCKTFIEYWAQCALLHVRFLLCDSLAIVEQIDFDIWISQASYIHSW